MGITISFYTQKGGVGKTTASAITSYLLAKEGYNVLAVDFDAQGDLTKMLTLMPTATFKGNTVYQACEKKKAADYIYPITDNLHLLPANRELSLLQSIFTPMLLKETLDTVKDRYDYIIIDLPPQMGIQITCGLIASDYTVHMQTTDPLAFQSLPDYWETLNEVKEYSSVKLAGILLTYQDAVAYVDKAIFRVLQAQYGDKVFGSIIHRRARIKEYSLTGISEKTKRDKTVLQPYADFVRELKQHVGT